MSAPRTHEIAVTGANGFIGSALVRALAGDAVPLTRADADLSGVFDLRTRLSGRHMVVHTAGCAHRRFDDTFRRVNVVATAELARQAADAGVKRFIFVSSIGAQVTPDEPYARTKLDAEAALAEVAAARGLELAVVRPAMVHGPGAPGNWRRLTRLVESGVPLPFGAIRNRRSFCSIDNLVSLLVYLTRMERVPAEPLPVADREPMSTPDAVCAIARGLGRPARLFPVPPALLLAAARVAGRGDDIRKLTDSLVIDTSRTTELTGWQPR